MRALITTQPGFGHFHPLVPLAQALATAGHEVAVACAPSFRPTVEAAGVRAFPAGLDWRVSGMGDAFPSMRQAWALPESQRQALAFQEVFAGATAARMAADVLVLAERWRPDVIVRSTYEFGGCLAAERLGVPHASVEVGAFYPEPVLRQLAAAPLGERRAELGLPADPTLAMPYRYLHLAFVPPSFADPAAPRPPTAHFLRPGPSDRPDGPALPAWVATLPARPLVYATLGTVFPVPEVFRAIITGVRDEPVNLIVTVGPEQDPAQFGPQPEHVQIAQYIPQSRLLPRCALVITHGGFSTVLGALGEGVPMVIVPISADQPLLARRCAALGVARVVAREAVRPEAIREAVRDLLGDPAYRERAGAIRREIAALPGPEHAVGLLERLAGEQRPIPAG
jgi:UDP:flavonoid glycosyltransferase YjiC (YdhE family)